MSVLANLVQCQREYGLRQAENGSFVDNQNIPLYLNSKGIPRTRGCFRPLVDLYIRISNCFLRCVGVDTSEEEQFMQLTDQSLKELRQKVFGGLQQQPLTSEQAALLREEKKVCQTIKKAAYRIWNNPQWDNWRKRVRTPSSMWYADGQTLPRINEMLAAANLQ